MIAVTDFQLVAQTRENIVVGSFSEPVTLYCVASKHGDCRYEWKRLDDRELVFPDTPVLYVNCGGLYQCTIFSGENGEHVTSKVINVELDPGNIGVFTMAKYKGLLVLFM